MSLEYKSYKHPEKNYSHDEGLNWDYGVSKRIGPL